MVMMLDITHNICLDNKLCQVRETVTVSTMLSFWIHLSEGTLPYSLHLSQHTLPLILQQSLYIRDIWPPRLTNTEPGRAYTPCHALWIRYA